MRRVTVVAPTEHLKHQWADAAARVGIRIDPNFRNSQGRHGAHYDGVALTYAQIAAKPALHAARTTADRTLVILDEVHHGGDALSWGEAVREAFEDATRRLALTGTPFRSDTAAIPFVEYERGPDGIRRSRADYTYGYGDALRDHVVRPVLFLSYSGNMRWRTKAGDEVSARLGEALTSDMTGQAWRTALDPNGEWIPSVLAAADKRLTEVRRAIPDAGGLVIATDQTDARAYAGHLARITGKSPTVVLSDDDGASSRIEEFSDGDARWMVAVRMVSEGVDVRGSRWACTRPRPRRPCSSRRPSGGSCVPASAARRRRCSCPACPTCRARERARARARPCAGPAAHRGGAGRGVQPEDALLAEANREDKASGELVQGSFEALEAQASFDRVLFDGGEFGTGADVGSDEELDFLRAARSARRGPGHDPPAPAAGRPDERALRTTQSAERERAEMDHRRAAELRKELQQLVSAWSRRSGQPHGSVHTELRRRCGGPEVPLATVEQLGARVATVRGWFVGKR